MLTITVPDTELWDEKTNTFISIKETTLQLEHSLVSMSKWESHWCKPFMTKEDKTQTEITDYIQCMTLNKNIDLNVYRCLSTTNKKAIEDYINAPMTASFVRDDGNKNQINREQITSELIYYWMITLGIPFECQKWHLNRLIMLIRICERKNTPSKKHSARELMSRNAALNAARRRKTGSRG